MRYDIRLRRHLVCVFVALMWASTATAQQFQILRAEYGFGDRWADVTPRLRELARANATFRIRNDMFGIDPIPGTVKSLRIYAREPRGEARTFEYPEGGIVDGSQFTGWRAGNWGFAEERAAEEPPQVLRADYGFADRRADVTERLQFLLRSRRPFRVGNDAFGVDPAPNRIKTLRIYTRGPRGNPRTFEYRENMEIDEAQFADWAGGGARGFDANGPVRGNGGQLTIISAAYGVRNRTSDVTTRLRSLIRDGRLNLVVGNAVANGDPAPGVPKALWITYAVGGGPERQVMILEGNPVSLP